MYMQMTSQPLISQSFKQQVIRLVDEPPQVMLIESNHHSQANDAANYIANKLLQHGQLPPGACLRFDATNVGIEDVREMQRIAHVGATPVLGRIIVFNNYDQLNLTAQSAMLKLLEQPISGTLYLLASAGGHVLATIQSRAKRLRVPPLALEDYEHYFPESTRDEILQALQISRGDTELTQQYLGGQLEELQMAKQLLSLGKLERLAMSDELAKDREKAIRMVSYIQSLLLFLCKQRIAAQDDAAAGKLQQALRATQITLRNLLHNGNCKLALDNLFIRM